MRLSLSVQGFIIAEGKQLVEMVGAVGKVRLCFSAAVLYVRESLLYRGDAAKTDLHNPNLTLLFSAHYTEYFTVLY